LDPSGTTQKVSVKSLKLLPDSSVLVFLSDSTVFEYDPRMRLWRQTLMKETHLLSAMSMLPTQQSLKS